MQNIKRIIHESREIYTLEDGTTAVLSGALRLKAESLPVTGDYVVISENGAIESIMPRTTELKRKDPSGGTQVMAANITHLLVVMALDKNFSLRRLERFFVLASSGGIKPVTVLTKADTADPVEAAVKEMEVKELAPHRVFVTSVVTQDGVDELKNSFGEGDVLCLAGLSGAGKSSLINALLGEGLMKTSGVRDHDKKGKHTTTGRYLFKSAEGFCIIDMPGIREVGLTADTDAVDDVFDDIAELAKGCRFRNCSHSDEPDCAVIKAVKDKTLDINRLSSFKKLKKEADTENLKAERQAKDKRISKLAKAAVKMKRK